MKIDLEDDHVFQLDLTVDEARNVDEAVSQRIEEALDEAQAPVFGDEKTVTFLVIQISK